MVKDILDVGPTDEPATPDTRAVVDDGEEFPDTPEEVGPAEAPLAPDFYTSARQKPKKRFRHSRK